MTACRGAAVCGSPASAPRPRLNRRSKVAAAGQNCSPARAPVGVASPNRVTRALEEGGRMGDKSVRGGHAKTAPAKTLKEKRHAKEDKRESSARTENTDAVSKVKKSS